MARRHKLKILPEYFEEVVSGKKTFEIRMNDRDFQVGEEALLEEWIPSAGYTGARALVKITYVTDYGQQIGFVVFAHELLWHGTKEEE